MDGLEKALTGRPQNTLRGERVKITQASPLQVQLRSGATVPAIAVGGLTYTAGSNGFALYSEGVLPIVWPTVT